MSIHVHIHIKDACAIDGSVKLLAHRHTATALITVLLPEGSARRCEGPGVFSKAAAAATESFNTGKAER